MNQKHKKILLRTTLYLLVTWLVLYLFFPFYWIIATSFRTSADIFQIPPELIPRSFTLENYIFALAESNVFKYALNSLFVAVITVTLSITISTLAAYALSRIDFKGKSIFFSLLASTQIFPMVVIIIPLYMMFRFLNLYNTHTSLIFIYTAVTIPIGIVLLLAYFNDIPKELEESSAIEGCNRLQILTKIIIPVVKPGIVATAIYIFITIWQEYLVALSLIGDRNKYTLTVGLTLFRSEFETNWGALMATAVIIAVPAIVSFLSVERYFIDSLAGSVKE